MSWKDKIEPEALIDSFTINSELSQAISLKRIADALEKLTKPVAMPQMTDEERKQFIEAYNNASNVMFNKS